MQSPLARVPLADGTLVALDGQPNQDLIPHLLAVSDVLGTGGMLPTPRACSPVRPWPWSAMAPSGSWACLRPSRWVPSGSSR
ncbi:hypothetical protein AB5I41_25220 [Sphingomonas sp. MMS24-JH45]